MTSAGPGSPTNSSPSQRYGRTLIKIGRFEPTSIPDITAERERWPSLVTAMSDAGYQALQTVPVRLHQRPFGSLTLLRTRMGHLSDDGLDLAQALAGSAAPAFMHWSVDRPAATTSSLACRAPSRPRPPLISPRAWSPCTRAWPSVRRLTC
ncbi:hypothetical protein ACPCVO_47985 [Streptomyces umbrinus]|uniref:hypothetical protein n=1 Tax=Streptomyces umbrinus TaxID=67370 RepID=UPI003C2D9225